MVGDESSSSTKETQVENMVRTMKAETDKSKVVNGEEIPEIVKTETPNREEPENKKISKKKKPIECEDIRKDSLLKISEEVANRRNGVAADVAVVEVMRKLVEDGSRALIAGNARIAVSNFVEVFDILPKLPSNAFGDCNAYIWLKYAFFISLIEANNYADLLNALRLLQDLQKSLFADVPIYHYAVTKLLIKFNRFRLAEAEIQKSWDTMKDHNFRNQFWPGTNEIIKETTRKGLEEYLGELSALCSCYHLPDATCKFGGCLSASTHPFPSREIFISDADFKGYVVLTCQEGCKIQYHPLCWKNVKDTFSNLDKLSDKDCLGKPCLTPDCKNTCNEPSVIHKIEIIGSDGNVKSQCVQDQVAENKQKEIALSKKRQRLKSDEHKIDKPSNKSKPRPKKGNLTDRSQSSDNIAASMKSPTPKENKSLQICGVTSVKSNIPVKNKESSSVEMNNSAAQKEFICSYFRMLLNTNGPLSKEKVEEEWEKFSPNCKPVSGLVSKSSGIFNLLKNSHNFVTIDDLLYIKESNETAAKEKFKPVEVKPVEVKPVEVKSVEVKPVEVKPVDVNASNSATNTGVGEKQQSWSKENAQLDSEIREMERELLANSAHNTNVNYNPCNINMMPSHSLEGARKDIPVMENDRPKSILHPLSHYVHGRPLAFGYYEQQKYDDRRYVIPVSGQNKFSEIGIHKNPEGNIIPEFMTGFEDYRLLPPVQWRDEGIEPIGDVDSAFKKMAIRTSMMRDPHIIPELVNRKEIFTQTEGACDDEIWVQHMQLAVNDLIKKNKDLVKLKDDMVRDHQSELEALRNQMHTLRNSYEEQIKALKESLSRNFDDDRRRMIALEQRMKLQEQILQCTKEELRKNDFDLLNVKRTLGTAILERIEKESNRQVQRLVTALASLPCNNADADAVGRAMSKWESTAEEASKAKAKFLQSCTKHQAKLYDGFATDSLQELVIPVVVEPAGPCPLDNLTINLLNDKENSEINFSRPQANAPPEIPPFRNRSAASIVASAPSPALVTTSAPLPAHSPVSAPLSPAALGARPREPPAATNGGSSALHRWPSTPSVQNSTHSSSASTARALTNFDKLLIELRRCYPSRSEEELYNAVKAVRRKNKYTLSGWTIEKIVIEVGSVLEWWREPSDGSMGLDKFMGWASDVVAPTDETFHGISKAAKSPAWVSNNSGVKRDAEKEDCCICLQGMSEPKTELVCLHSFHTQCIRKWLSKESVCPICRKFTRMPDEFPTLK